MAELRSRQRYPEPTVGAIILNRRGEMLLVRSHKWGDRFTIAGGHVEVGEKLEDALRREIMEEVGLEIKDVRFLMTQEAIFSEEFWEKRHFIFFDYACRCRNAQVRVDGKEIQSFEWVKPGDALTMKVDSFTARMIRAYLSSVGKRSRSARTRVAPR
jgi:nucleoside triphosphatase